MQDGARYLEIPRRLYLQGQRMLRRMVDMPLKMATAKLEEAWQKGSQDEDKLKLEPSPTVPVSTPISEPVLAWPSPLKLCDLRRIHHQRSASPAGISHWASRLIPTGWLCASAGWDDG